jgi:TRAP transporter TAXI family solute receptor
MNRPYIPIFRTVVALAAAALLSLPVAAQDLKFLRIGTGSISGVYFPVGGLIASAISHPRGESLCGQGGSCGVPGLVAVAQASRGSVANVRQIAAGRIEAALVQADVAYFAVKGMGVFAGGKAVPGLRAVANLYPEAVHVVVRRNSRIYGIGDLKGKRISLDLKGSGTRALANLVLEEYGIDPESLNRLNSQVGPAVDRLQSGRLDAFFFVGGFPAPTITRLSKDVPLRLLPISKEKAASIMKADPFLAVVSIPASVYGRRRATPTLAVGALFTVSDKVSADLVYGITRALWHPTTRSILDQGPLATRQMRLGNALKGVAIPLHKGAARFYREMGLIAKSPPKAKPAPKAIPGSPGKPAPRAKPETPAKPASKSSI